MTKKTSGSPKTERTAYPGIYKRTEANGTVWYQCKPRFRNYRGPKSHAERRLTDARDWMEEQRRLSRRQGGIATVKKTLAEAIDAYVETELPKLAPTERPNRRRHLTWWRGRRGVMLLREISRGDVKLDLQALRDGDPSAVVRHRYRSTPRPVSYATAQRYRAALSAVLSAAVEEWGWLESNPLHTGGRRKKAKGEREKERDRELLPEERERLWKACRDSRDKRLYPLVLCYYASGAREDELMRLQWSNVSLHPTEYDPALGASRPGVPRARALDTKNGEDRTIFFPGEAGEVLRELARQPRLSRYVFAAPDDGPSGAPAFPSGAWRYAKKKARIQDFWVHDLRHCWACNLLDSGASVPQLMILGGWRSPAMIRRYAKRAQQHGSDAVTAMQSRGLV